MLTVADAAVFVANLENRALSLGACLCEFTSVLVVLRLVGHTVRTQRQPPLVLDRSR